MSGREEEIISGVLEREGWPHYTNRSTDDGGPTKGGVTIKTLSAWRGRAVTPEEVSALGEREARDIYRAMFIRQPRFHEIADEDLRVVVIDAGVLWGPRRAAGWLQTAINEERAAQGLTSFAVLAVDSALGPKTFDALAVCAPRRLAIRFLALWIRRMGKRVTESPYNAANAAGWANRVADHLIAAGLSS